MHGTRLLLLVLVCTLVPLGVEAESSQADAGREKEWHTEVAQGLEAMEAEIQSIVEAHADLFPSMPAFTWSAHEMTLLVAYAEAARSLAMHRIHASLEVPAGSSTSRLAQDELVGRLHSLQASLATDASIQLDALTGVWLPAFGPELEELAWRWLPVFELAGRDWQLARLTPSPAPAAGQPMPRIMESAITLETFRVSWQHLEPAVPGDFGSPGLEWPDLHRVQRNLTYQGGSVSQAARAMHRHAADAEAVGALPSALMFTLLIEQVHVRESMIGLAAVHGLDLRPYLEQELERFAELPSSPLLAAAIAHAHAALAGDGAEGARSLHQAEALSAFAPVRLLRGLPPPPAPTLPESDMQQAPAIGIPLLVTAVLLALRVNRVKRVRGSPEPAPRLGQ